jgi:hypothetical protein
MAKSLFCYIGATTFYRQTLFSMGLSFDRYNFDLHFLMALYNVNYELKPCQSKKCKSEKCPSIKCRGTCEIYYIEPVCREY